MMTPPSITHHELLLVEAIQNRLRGKVKGCVMARLEELVDEELKMVTVETLEHYKILEDLSHQICVRAKVVHEG